MAALHLKRTEYNRLKLPSKSNVKTWKVRNTLSILIPTSLPAIAPIAIDGTNNPQGTYKASGKIRSTWKKIEAHLDTKSEYRKYELENQSHYQLPKSALKQRNISNRLCKKAFEAYLNTAAKYTSMIVVINFVTRKCFVLIVTQVNHVVFWPTSIKELK